MSGPGRRARVVIVGAAGRDFHNFNVVYSDVPHTYVMRVASSGIRGVEGS